MASIVNKRQQARNERTLQDLIKNVPGNDRCADCFVRNPGWASWSLGVFLCVRCASIHRKLGTHVSKVKSLSMDTWSLEQVENIKKNGNISSNRTYNPRSVKPNIPVDADEVDSVMERFIRDKYQHKAFANDPTVRHNTGSSSNSAEDIPPPLPPKNGPPRFSTALRSSSSQYPQGRQLPSPPASDATNSSNASRDALRLSRIPEAEPNIPRRSFDSKLGQLRDMGFTNESRNSTVLKALNGNVERAVEALVRLREGDAQAQSRSGTPNGISFETPNPPLQRSQTTGLGMGIANGGGMASLSTHSTGNAIARNQTGPNPFNPFMNAPQPSHMQSIEQTFQNMNIAQQQQQQQQQPQQPQPLFPHNTGTWVPNQPQSSNNNPFLRTFTPPISPSPFQYTGTAPAVQPQQTGVASYNPQYPQPGSNSFQPTSNSQNFSSSNPFMSVQQQHQQDSTQYQDQNQARPVPSMPSWIQQPYTDGGQQQTQHQQQYQPQAQSNQSQHPPNPPMMENNNPFNSHMQNYQQQESHFMPNHQSQVQPQQSVTYNPYLQQQQQQQQQPLSAQPTGTLYRDKSSILSLYNNTHSPSSSFSSQPQAQGQPQQFSTSAFPAPQRSVTMPLTTSSSQPQQQQSMTQAHQGLNSNNPFQPQTGMGMGHVSRDSVMFASAGPGQRSASPDAFGGLSSRWR